MRRVAPLLALVALLSGCASFPSPGVRTIDGASGDVDLVGDGLNVTADAANHSVRVALPQVVHARSIVACRANCAGVDFPEGMVIAEGSLVSLNNVSLNANGPDHDSAVFFYDGGQLTGQYLRWDDAGTRFELSRDLDALGNVTARHHVGTVTAIALGGGGGTVHVATAATEGNEATVFLRGSGRLANGTARVDFPAAFKVLVGEGPITAQVTPTSRGQALMVSQKARDHIAVETVTGATSDQTFDYFVQATRAASEDFATVLG